MRSYSRNIKKWERERESGKTAAPNYEMAASLRSLNLPGLFTMDSLLLTQCVNAVRFPHETIEYYVDNLVTMVIQLDMVRPIIWIGKRKSVAYTQYTHIYAYNL